MSQSRAAAWDTDSPSPAQLKEFFAQIERGRITHSRLQGFLRGFASTSIHLNVLAGQTVPEPHYYNMTGYTIKIVDHAGELKVAMPPWFTTASHGVYEDHHWTAFFPGNSQRVPVVVKRYDAPQNLPEPKTGVFHIVWPAVVVCARETGREVYDLLVPYDPEVDEDEQTITFTRFVAA
jgi:hypothetical protein